MHTSLLVAALFLAAVLVATASRGEDFAPFAWYGTSWPKGDWSDLPAPYRTPFKSCGGGVECQRKQKKRR